jgi:endonuclease/exonuclease/phosphatase family metal-dependent hydrolase
MRIATFNVHHWVDARFHANTAAIQELLRALRCDVVALNEVPRDRLGLDRVAHALGLQAAFGEASDLGNALLSPHPLRDVRTVPLGSGEAEARSVLLATAQTPAGPIEVCCTHLDPDWESERLAQLADLKGAVDGSCDAAHVVVGDFNALRLSDYAPDRLAAVAAMRARGEREPPLGDAVRRMDAWGYLDCVRLARAGSVEDYARELEAPLPLADVATCWAGTRIDFVWASPAFVARHFPRAWRRVASDASDHSPVVVDFDQVAR